MRSNHTIRLQNGACSLETGFVWSDLLTNFERISDHCSNIAACIIDASENNMNVHKSVRDMKTNSECFNSKFASGYEQ